MADKDLLMQAACASNHDLLAIPQGAFMEAQLLLDPRVRVESFNLEGITWGADYVRHDAPPEWSHPSAQGDYNFVSGTAYPSGVFRTDAVSVGMSDGEVSYVTNVHTGAAAEARLTTDGCGPVFGSFGAGSASVYINHNGDEEVVSPGGVQDAIAHMRQVLERDPSAIVPQALTDWMNEHSPATEPLAPAHTPIGELIGSWSPNR